MQIELAFYSAVVRILIIVEIHWIFYMYYASCWIR